MFLTPSRKDDVRFLFSPCLGCIVLLYERQWVQDPTFDTATDPPIHGTITIVWQRERADVMMPWFLAAEEDGCGVPRSLQSGESGPDRHDSLPEAQIG